MQSLRGSFPGASYGGLLFTVEIENSEIGPFKEEWSQQKGKPCLTCLVLDISKNKGKNSRMMMHNCELRVELRHNITWSQWVATIVPVIVKYVGSSSLKSRQLSWPYYLCTYSQAITSHLHHQQENLQKFWWPEDAYNKILVPLSDHVPVRTLTL